MLILTRKSGQEVVIDGHIIVKIISMKGGQVRIAFDAPSDVSIHRREIQNKIELEEGHHE